MSDSPWPTSGSPSGWEIDCHYKHHIEASFVISGSATVTEYATGNSWDVGPGDLYVVGPKDRHHVSTKTEMHAVTVFNPPLIGNENPDEDGAYPPSGDVPLSLGWGVGADDVSEAGCRHSGSQR